MGKYWKLNVSEGIAELCLDFPESEINILQHDVLNELREIIKDFPAGREIQALLFTSAKKRIFIAGADIKEIDRIDSKSLAVKLAEEGKQLLRQIEDLPFPTIAVINGACLGGGYELALACTKRVASSSANVKIGLPEVNLGILPGFGGSIRLPHLIGLRKALPMILGGKILGAAKAKRAGVVDEVFDEEHLLEKSRDYAKRLIGSSQGKNGKYKVPLWEKWLGPALIIPQAKKEVMKRTKGFYPAPLKILELVRETYGKDMADGFRKESEAFSELAVTEVSKNLIKLFFLTERYKKLKWTSVEKPVPAVTRCGILGAGVMGGGIAQLVSSRGIAVEVKDISEKALEGAMNEAKRLYEEGVKRGKFKEAEVAEKLKLIHTGAQNEDLGRCDLIIEAVVEDMKIKEKVFAEVSNATKAETVIASNTSSLSITKMAQASRFPERVTGLHFFNPVHRMPLVEVIRAEHSSEFNIERTIAFARGLGKTVVVVKDSPGFLVNRLLLPYLNEAAYLLEEGLTTREIDRAALAFGMPMGPLALVDQIGIDVSYKVAHIFQEAFGDRMKVSSVLDTVKSRGLLGKKGKLGFYVYDGKKKTVNSNLQFGSKEKRISSEDDILKRLIYIMINEAALCLAEKIIDGPATVDIAMILGTGFPPFRAGLLRYADSVGLKTIVDALRSFEKQTGAGRFHPAPYLVELAEANRGFYALNKDKITASH